ncbi:MAG: DUF5719 family protein [Dermatophilaceae bacterium]
MTGSAAARGRAVARRHLPGVSRVLVAAGGTAVLVWAATARPVTLDLVGADDAAAGSLAGAGLVTAQSLGCPGNGLSGLAAAPDIAVGGSVAVASAPMPLLPAQPAGAGAAELRSGSAVLAALTAARPGAASGALPGRGPVIVDATGASAPGVAAAQEWRLEGAELRGLSGASCSPASTDAWLVAGGAGPGRQERLVLVNPGANPVTATITVLGGSGPLGEPRTETVPPRGRVAALLDAFTGDEAQAVVHVASDGAGLQASVTDTWVDGSTALGAESVDAGAAPAVRQTIPAAVVSGYTSVRVAVPGSDAAVVRVSLLGRDGLVPVTGASVLSVPGESVGDLPLRGLPTGVYAVLVTADVPVVASVFSATGGRGAPGEFAWAAAAPDIRDLAGAALPSTPGVSRGLHLVSTEGASVAEVVTVSAAGQATTRQISLLADRTTVVSLDGASAVWVQRSGGSGELRSSVVSISGTGAATMLTAAVLRPAAVTSPVSRAFPLP